MESNDREIARIKAKLASLAEQLDSLIDAGAEEGKDFVQEKSSLLQDKIDTWKDRSKMIHKNLEKAEEYAKENPWQVIAGVVVLGIIAGYLLNNRD